MRAFLTLLIIILLLAPLSFSQSVTNVTATIVDPNSVVYAYGTFTIELFNPTILQPIYGGYPLQPSQATYSGQLDVNGNLGVTLPSNSFISPTGTQWSFNICANPAQVSMIFPPVTLPCASFNRSVSGGSQVLTFVMPVIPTLGGGIGGSSGLPSSTVLGLPAAGSNTNKSFLVIDGINSSDCTIGGGSFRVACASNGVAWVPLGGGGTLAGDVTGPAGSNTVASISGLPVVFSTPSVGQTLTITNTPTLINAYPGVPVDSSNPSTLPCSGASSDRATYLNWTAGASLLLPNAVGACGSNLPFVVANKSGGALALTPSSPNNIDGGASQAPSSVLNSWAAYVYQDSAGPNWFSIKLPTLTAFPSCPDTAGNHMNFTTAGGFICGVTGSGSPGAPDSSIQYRVNSSTFGGFGSWNPLNNTLQLPQGTMINSPNVGAGYTFGVAPPLPAGWNQARGGLVLPWGGQICSQDMLVPAACLVAGVTGFNGTFINPILNGTPSGTGIPTITLKKGSGIANYVSASTSYVQVDNTNLLYTITIPTGWKLMIDVAGAVTTATAVATASLELTDGGVALQEIQSVPTATGSFEPFTLGWVVNGDGASHSIDLRYKTSNGADSVTILNSTATLLPVMTFLLTPSN